MIIDTHMHEKTFSDDSFISLETIVSRAKQMGLDGVCITDHESNGLKERAKAYAKETGFLIIVGAEILTHEGDITVFGLDQLPTEKLHAQALIDLVAKAGGVAMSAHPFRQNNRGLGNHLRNVRGLAGIEAFNGSTPHHHNMTAYHLAKELRIPTFGASDAHITEKIGQYATQFPAMIRDTQDFIEAVKDGITAPVVYTKQGYRAFDPHDRNTVSIFLNTFSQDLSSMTL